MDRITEMGMDSQGTDMVTAVYMQDVVDDFTADMNGDGVFDGNIGNTEDHRYGNSGIDGTSFGPKFGQTDGKHYLTVGAGIYANTWRTDNDHQVIWQFDTDNWHEYEQPLIEAEPHRNGPDYDGKYFIHTGNTTYGVQNIEYDATLERWWFPVYTGTKPEFPNYRMFGVLPGLTGSVRVFWGEGERGPSHPRKR